MQELTVIILTFNEAQHIERCIQSVLSLGPRIVVVDSYSSDATCSLAKSAGSDVYQNEFVSQAQQFQWAMDNCIVKTEWVFRLDADETIDDDLAGNIRDFIANNGCGYNGGILHRKHVFLGKWIQYGGRYPLPMLRLFRNGKAHIEQRWMDEHIVLDDGESIVLAGGFVDENLNPVSWFIDKHNKYATREMVDVMLHKLRPEDRLKIPKGTGVSIRVRRMLKESVYMKLPYFVGPFFYFVFRYFFQLGFLDGMRGFAYHFIQGFWYRVLVDLKCLEVERAWLNCRSYDEKIRVLQELSGYELFE